MKSLISKLVLIFNNFIKFKIEPKFFLAFSSIICYNLVLILPVFFHINVIIILFFLIHYISLIFVFNIKYPKLLMDIFLKYQFELCSVYSQSMLPNKSFFFAFFFAATLLDNYKYILLYFLLMLLILFSICLSKVFPNKIGIPLLNFYKNHSSESVFINFCGNPYSAVGSGLTKIVYKTGGKLAVMTGVVIIGQDALHKSKIGQPICYKFEEFLNNGEHPTKKPFLFKKNGPSWGDTLVKSLGDSLQPKK